MIILKPANSDGPEKSDPAVLKPDTRNTETDSQLKSSGVTKAAQSQSSKNGSFGPAVASSSQPNGEGN